MMMDRKNGNKDLRFLRTEKALIEAMNDLLVDKDFDDITINDICLEATVSRTAFYQHFEDKYALVMAWIIAKFKPPTELFCDRSLAEYYNRLFDAMSAHHNQILHLVQPDGNKELHWRISAMWGDGLKRYYENKHQQGARFDVPYEIIALYNSSGLITLIWQYILHGYPYPKETIVAYIIRKIQQSNDFIHP